MLCLLMVEPGGLPPEVLSEALDLDLESGFEVIRHAEAARLIGWSGSLVRAAIPVLRDPAIVRETEIRAAAARLAESPRARERGFAALPAVRAGLSLDNELRSDAIKALHARETPRDTDIWEETAVTFSSHHDDLLAGVGRPPSPASSS